MSRKKGSKLTEEHKKKIGLANKGRVHTEEYKNRCRMNTVGKKQSKQHIERRVANFRGKKYSLAHRLAISNAHKKLVILGLHKLGDGTKTPKRIKLFKSFEWKLWRESVFKRDEYTCQVCKQTGGKLQAHHIKPHTIFPEYIFDIDNGQTLCISCHRKTDSWGYRAVKLLEEYKTITK